MHNYTILVLEISIDLPSSVHPGRRDRRYYQEALVAMLYQAGDLSSKEACDVLSISRREFAEVLRRFRVSIMPDDDESIATELRA